MWGMGKALEVDTAFTFLKSIYNLIVPLGLGTITIELQETF